MLFVSGSLKGVEFTTAKQHIAACPLCADAADGLRMWLKENNPPEVTVPELVEEPVSEVSEVTGKHSFVKASPYKSGGRKLNKFDARTDAINQRIRQRLHSHSVIEATENKRLSYKPFVWFAAAASVVLFIGGFYVVWLQSQLTTLKLAEERASQMLMLQNPVNPDTLTILLPGNKTVLAVNEKKTKGIPAASEQLSLDEDQSVINEMIVSDANKEIAQVDGIALPQNVPVDKPVVLKEEARVAEANRDNPATMSKSAGTAMKKADTGDKSKAIYTIVEEMPSFPGGDAARNKFLSHNIVYPTQAAVNGIQGTVYLSFIVNTDGKIEDVKILRGIGAGCDEEAMRVANLMPRWKPGKQNGKIVNVFYTMPVDFKLQ
jgi:TonB family protein